MLFCYVGFVLSFGDVIGCGGWFDLTCCFAFDCGLVILVGVLLVCVIIPSVVIVFWLFIAGTWMFCCCLLFGC